MKRIIAAVLLTFPISIYADYQKEVPIDDSSEDDPVYAEMLEQKFQETLHDFQINESFAGSLVKMTWKGLLYQVDRRSEPKPRPGLPPTRTDSLTSFVTNLSASAQGSLHIEVKREYNEDGTLKSETWTIDVGGGWSSSTGMQESFQKNHR